MRLIALNEMYAVESSDDDRIQRGDMNLREVHIDLLRAMHTGYGFPVHDREMERCRQARVDAAQRGARIDKRRVFGIMQVRSAPAAPVVPVESNPDQ